MIDWNKQKSEWPHLRHLEFPHVPRNRVVDILIGINAIEFHSHLEEIPGLQGEPVARRTPLGWTCVGPCQRNIALSEVCSHCAFHIAMKEDEVDNLDCTLQRFWDLESIGLVTGKEETSTPDDLEAEKKVANSLRYVNGRYEVGIPWKKNEPQLENNYNLAYKRLETLEQSLKRRPNVAESYQKVIEDHLSKRYIRKLTRQEKQRPKWYLPHFPVVRNDRSTTKVRIVFDAACSFQGKSLNDSMHTGPKQQKEVLDVLLRFRRDRSALSGDISVMFLQVIMAESDRPYHSFLWRDLKSGTPDVYEFQRLVFGDKESPYLSQAVCREHAKRNANEYPDAAMTALDSMYMDDTLDSVSNVAEVINLRRNLTAMMAQAGMKIRKWCSNEAVVMAGVSPLDRTQGSIEIRDKTLPTISLLNLEN